MSRHIEAARQDYFRTKTRSSLDVVESKGKKSVRKRPKQQRVVEKRLSSLQTRVRDYLDAAYLRGQRKKEQSVGGEKHGGLMGRRLLNAFMQTKDFDAFYEIAIKEALKGASWHQDSHRFRGALFQAVVLAHIKATMTDSTQVLLRGKDVTKFTQMVNPGMTVFEHPYNQQGIDHRYIPDFLILGINNGNVGVDEYGEISLSTDPDKYTPQLAGFLQGKSRLGPLMRQARFRIITPLMDSPLGMQIVPGIEYVDTEPILVTHSDFTHFEKEVSASYRKTPQSLTLRQIRREVQASHGEPSFFRS